MAPHLFRTSQDRQREEMLRAQGLRPGSDGIGAFSPMLRTAQTNDVAPTGSSGLGRFSSMLGDIDSENVPNATFNDRSGNLPTAVQAPQQIGSNRDGTPITTGGTPPLMTSEVPPLSANSIGSAGSMLGIPELAAVPLAAATGYNTVTGVGNAIKGNKLSTQEQLALALPTFGLSFAFNPLVDLFGSGKGKQQVGRDSFRDLLVKQGIAQRPEGTDETFINLFGGGQFDAGKDGGDRLTNPDGTSRRYFEVDMTAPGIGDAINALNPLGLILAQQSGTEQAAATGYLVNSVMSGGGDAGQIKNRILDIYQKSGFTPDQIDSGLQQLAQVGKISDSDLKIYQNAINSISSPGQTQSLTIGGSPAMNIPQPKPQVDMSLMAPPSDPLAQTRQAYDQAQQRNEQRLNLFPKQDNTLPLGAFR